MLEASQREISIGGTGFSAWPTRRISRAKAMELNLISCCWGAYHLIELRWGKMPWQCVYLAPLVCTEAKIAIGQSVAVFLRNNQIEFSSNLATPDPRVGVLTSGQSSPGAEPS